MKNLWRQFIRFHRKFFDTVWKKRKKFHSNKKNISWNWFTMIIVNIFLRISCFHGILFIFVHRVWVNTFLKYWIPNTNIPQKFYWIPNTSILFFIWNVLKIPIPISIPNTCWNINNNNNFHFSEVLLLQWFSCSFIYLYFLELTKEWFSCNNNCLSKFFIFQISIIESKK